MNGVLQAPDNQRNGLRFRSLTIKIALYLLLARCGPYSGTVCIDDRTVVAHFEARVKISWRL